MLKGEIPFDLDLSLTSRRDLTTVMLQLLYW